MTKIRIHFINGETLVVGCNNSIKPDNRTSAVIETLSLIDNKNHKMLTIVANNVAYIETDNDPKNEECDFTAVILQKKEE